MPEGIRWSSREEGIEFLEEFFDYAGYHARDMREPLRQSAEYINRTIAEEFSSYGERSGGWRPLSDDYWDWKEKHAPGDPMLMLRPSLLEGGSGTPKGGHMKDALLDPAAWHIQMQHAEYLPDSTRAAWHQGGATRKHESKDKTTVDVLPSRPMLFLLEEDFQHIEGIFADWLDELRTANVRRGPVDPSIRPSLFG